MERDRHSHATAREETEPLTFILGEQIPNGPGHVVITVRSGLLEESAEASLTFPDAGVGPRIPTSGVSPWWLLALAATLVLTFSAAITAMTARRLRRP